MPRPWSMPTRCLPQGLRLRHQNSDNPGRQPLARCSRGLASANFCPCRGNFGGFGTDPRPSCRGKPRPAFLQPRHHPVKARRRPFSKPRPIAGGIALALVSGIPCQTPAARSPSARTAHCPSRPRLFTRRAETDRPARRARTTKARRFPSRHQSTAQKHQRLGTSSPFESAPSPLRPHVVDPKTRGPQPHIGRKADRVFPDQTVGSWPRNCAPSRKLFVSASASWPIAGHKKQCKLLPGRIALIKPQTADLIIWRARLPGRLDFSQLEAIFLDIPRAARIASPPPRTSNAISRCGPQVAQKRLSFGRIEGRVFHLSAIRGELFVGIEPLQLTGRQPQASSALLGVACLAHVGKLADSLSGHPFRQAKKGYPPPRRLPARAPEMPLTVLIEPGARISQRSMSRATRQVPLQRSEQPIGGRQRQPRPQTACATTCMLFGLRTKRG